MNSRATYFHDATVARLVTLAAFSLVALVLLGLGNPAKAADSHTLTDSAARSRCFSSTIAHA
jgi:hypothetical protein